MNLRSLPLVGSVWSDAADAGQVLKRAWLALAALYGLLVLHFVYYYATGSDTRSLPLRLLIGAFIAATVGVAAFGVWLRSARLEALRRGALRFETVYAVIGLAILAGFGFIIRPEWVYAQAGITLATTFAVGYWTLYEDRPIARPRLWIAAVVVIVIAITAVRAYGLTTYPYIENTDEPWSFGRAFSFYKTGQFSDWIQYYGGHDTNRYFVLMSLWMRLVGAGFWQARFFSLLMTFPVILVASLAARNLYDRRTAIFTAGALLSAAVLMEGVRVRHDLGITLAIVLSLWVYTEAMKRNRNALHLLAGAIIGWGWFGHYHAVVFGIALTLAFYGPGYLQRLRRGEWRPPAPMVLYGVGGLLGALTVLVVQIIPEWAGFINTRQPRNPTDTFGLIQAIFDHFRTLAIYSYPEFLVIVIAMVAAIWRRRRSDVTIVLVILLSHIGLGVAARYRYNNIPMPLAPVYGILIGSLFADGLRKLPAVKDALIGRRSAAVFAGFALVMIGSTIKPPLLHVLERGSVQLEPNAAALWVREHLPPGAKVAAENRYFFWLMDYHFISPGTIKIMPPELRAQFATEEAIWDDINPDAIIFDPNLSTYGFLQPLLDSDYVQRRGYVEVADIPGDDVPIRIFARPSSLIDADTPPPQE